MLHVLKKWSSFLLLNREKKDLYIPLYLCQDHLTISQNVHNACSFSLPAVFLSHFCGGALQEKSNSPHTVAIRLTVIILSQVFTQIYWWLFFFPQPSARCHANVEIMRLICRSDSMLKRKALYISWQCKFPGPLDSWLEHGITRRSGTGIKRAVTKSGHCCLPWEQFWTPWAQMVPFLSNFRQKEDMTPVYVRVLLCMKPDVWEDRTTFSLCHFSIKLEETHHR